MKREAMLYEKTADGRVHCFLCAHQCRIAPSQFGVCGVRQNIDGVLYTLVYADVIAAHIDPIEKKPLYHFLPGTSSFSIATVGCNFRCGFCQNWQISQSSKRDGAVAAGRDLPPEAIVSEAAGNGCRSISYTYTEPTIFFEYAFDTARLAREAGLRNVFVTNGYMTAQALNTIHPFLDAANVDLKAFREESYRDVCKGHLQPVLDSISYMKKLGIWVEITTLVVPGMNDSAEELAGIAGFIAGIDKDMPWHVSRFHPDYKFDSQDATPVETLKMARKIGREKGLKYIYIGNAPENQDTHCPGCNKCVVTRDYYSVGSVNIEDGKCTSCGANIAGVWV